MSLGEIVMEARQVTRILQGEIPTTLIDGVDFAVRSGEFVAVTGPSGSGKSSLLYMLGLLDRPTRGEVRIAGASTQALSENARADLRLGSLGFVFQFHFLLPEFTITENVALPMRALGKLSNRAIIARAGDLLASFGLGDHLHKTPDQMSGGQRQRVAVARSLANDPPVILADEPTGSLDSVSTAQVFGILRDLVAVHGKSVIAVTHDLNLAAQMHRRIHIVDGRVEKDEHVTTPAG
jgi:lipoprotein-releasing system ATP-binding protein